MEYGTLEWSNSNGKVKQVEIDGNYLSTAIIIDDYIYATTSLIYAGGSHIELFQVDKEKEDIMIMVSKFHNFKRLNELKYSKV